MAAKSSAAELAVAKSEGLAQILAVAIVTGAETIDTAGNPINRAVKEALVLHAHELLTLHDLKPEAVLAGLGGEGGDNHWAPSAHDDNN